jgi:hypothetical protein
MDHKDYIDSFLDSDINDILNSIVSGKDDEYGSMMPPPPPLELDGTRAIPELDLSNDYLLSLNSDYFGT